MTMNILEKKALIGIVSVGVLFVVSIFYIGQRNLWFEPKEQYRTKINDADGLRVGSIVTLAGLRVGDVEALKVAKDNSIEVTFSVKKSLAERITEKSVAKLHRMFLIGEKRIELLPSSEGSVIKPGGLVTGVDSTEIADMISGKNMSSLMDRLGGLESSLSKWADSFTLLSDKLKPEEIVAIYELIRPTLASVKTFTTEMKAFTTLSSEIRRDFIKNKLAKNTMTNVAKTLKPLARREQLLEDALDSVGRLTTELANYPTFAKDVVDALKETALTLKAIQKTWLLRDHVESVKEEKKKNQQKKK